MNVILATHSHFPLNVSISNIFLFFGQSKTRTQYILGFCIVKTNELQEMSGEPNDDTLIFLTY